MIKNQSAKSRIVKHKFAGQGIVEFALVIPIILTLIFGIFEVGRAYWIYSAVTNSSREAARFASSVSDNGFGTPNYLDCPAIRAAAKRIGEPGQVVDADINISYDEGPSGVSIGSCPVPSYAVELGDRVVVSVTGHFQPLDAMPLFSFPSFDFTSVSRRTIIKDVDLLSTPVSP